ncbi:MAG: MarR family transcriptional regulator [Ruminiclostridium sp.]|nr:MarR family transcriptional regulator [Ruminiclostridium sp.]
MTEACEELRLKNQLCFPIYLCAKEITRKYGMLLDELDLTYTQYIVMMYFWEMHSSNVKELGKTLMLDPSTLTPILKKLEAKGYVRRERSAADERNLSITLTETGEALKSAALPIHDRMCGYIGLSEEEARTMYLLTAKVIANVSKE